MKTWVLTGKADRRFRMGHPWVYSNELTESPKGIEAGDAIELKDATGKFLARGYGNPHSLIAFRAMSREPGEAEPMSGPGVRMRLEKALELRRKLGLENISHRLSYGEADRLPGLIIDSYAVVDALGGGSRVFVVQAHTAGADRMLPWVDETLEALFPGSGLVIKNDLGVRELEGVKPEEPRMIRMPKGQDAKSVKILVAPASFNGNGAGAKPEPVTFTVDLLGGQKTGFFLDQVSNVKLAIDRCVQKGLPPQPRVLDLCTYVGQWSTQFARALKAMGYDPEFTLVDASAKALELAEQNVKAQGARVKTLKGDVLEDLVKLDANSFDIVISDPPALIKGRKNIPQGTHAYLQLNTQVFRLARMGAFIVSCSCSALLEEEEFLKSLSKAAHRNSRKILWVGRGAQAPDHPMLAEFPEGRYLKCFVGVVQ